MPQTARVIVYAVADQALKRMLKSPFVLTTFAVPIPEGNGIS